ncbi:MAG TPA: parallel beta-helix domain-containing protein [Panacibacter sp.]|nr:parallel beta-helix domain-containing protein [Panacibacter sp.]
MRHLIFLCGCLAAVTAVAQPSLYKQLQTKLIEAKNGDTIRLPEGTFSMPGSLSMEGKNDIVILGAGMDKTILSFKYQATGAEGMKISNGRHIKLIDFTVQDAKGDCIKVQQVNGLVFKNIKTEWTGKPSSKNGGYALYPVQCQNVLIDGCWAIGASDAGIYVGQSKNIIVRNSKAYHNVAGIEIENSSYADVYDNEAWENSGGILVFDLPDLPVKLGTQTRVYNNNIHDNNHKNFAPKGNIVAKVPLGTGMLLLASQQVEVFENNIINNRTSGIAVTSYYISENPVKDTVYDPYPHDVYIHNNAMKRLRQRATGKGRMGKMYRFKLKFGKDVPHIMYDGIADEKNKTQVICLYNNNEETFANIDAGNGFKNKSRDVKPYQCKGKSYEPVKLEWE